MNFRNMTISFAVLTLVGCKNIFEDNDVTLDGSTPYSEVKYPKKKHIYKATEPFRLGVGYSDKDKIAEVDVKITRLGGDLKESASVIAFTTYPNLQMCNLDTTFAANTFTAGKYQARVRAIDSRKNELLQDIAFEIK